ncbi:MAG TPA: 4Fe-4S dicluster domain-containing protein [Kiritimatiellia bacterium]|nr:4Fe-4S dicluster domain-containing protein [Kiritimatiellia bacterium]HMP34453.1 4Fe-4S dicluster domain-containing protein [Kiritimatiellia bacterium]
MKPLAMTKLSLKSLFKAPATVAYPAIPREYFPGTRGRILIEPSTCNLCVICDVRCPTKAIKVDRKGQTWTIDRLRCIQCGACIEACPRKCLTNENRYSDPVTAKETLTVPIPFVPPAPKPKPAAPAAAAPAPAPAPATTPEISDAKDGPV